VVEDEAHHVALRRVGLVVRRRRHDPFRRTSVFVGRQLAGGDQLAKAELGHRRPLPGIRLQDPKGKLRRRHEEDEEKQERRTRKRKKKL
jgi:hypothetical protein